MATEKRLIDANALKDKFLYLRKMWSETEIVLTINDAKTVDAVEVVRCKDCTHGVTDEEKTGMCKCVESAEYDSECGIWLGFVEYHTPDFFCAFGERKVNGTA